MRYPFFRFSMIRIRRLMPLLYFLLLTTVSCESPKIDPQSRAGSGPPIPIYPEPDPEQQDKTEKKKTPQNAPTAKVAPSGDRAATTAAPATGTGGQASGVASILTTPINVYFKAKDKINSLQIENGLKNFRAQKDRNPKDFAEFEAEVLKPAAIKLPALKQDTDRYYFDPQRGNYGELMVRKAD